MVAVFFLHLIVGLLLIFILGDWGLGLGLKEIVMSCVDGCEMGKGKEQSYLYLAAT